MARPSLEVADVLRVHGAAYARAHAGHLSLGQLKVMSAITACRTAALGGHVARCDDCGHVEIAYNSCRNRHCPKCQGAAARQWLAERQAELLPVAYYHVVFTLPAPVAAIAFQNKAAIYDLLFKAAAETLITIAADPKHLGARVGITAVLHTWGSAMTHHPHIHMIVPGGGLSPDGARWIACKPGFFLPVRVLSRLFRRLFLEGLAALHHAGRLAFFGDLAALAGKEAFEAALAPLRRSEWVVYAKRPFAGPEAVLAYLSRYTHRVAISNSRLLSFHGGNVAFRWKDYRARGKTPAKLDQVHVAVSGRVHPPFSHARPAQRLPPHSPLRAVRQPEARRKYHSPAPTHCQDRGRRKTSVRPRRDNPSAANDNARSFRGGGAQSLPLLRWTHARRRDFCARRDAAQLQDRLRGVRHVMTKTKARPHAAGITSTPKGAGHDDLVASAPKMRETVGLIKLNVATAAIGRRQNAPRPSLQKPLACATALRTGTPLP